MDGRTCFARDVDGGIRSRHSSVLLARREFVFKSCPCQVPCRIAVLLQHPDPLAPSRVAAAACVSDLTTPTDRDHSLTRDIHKILAISLRTVSKHVDTYFGDTTHTLGAEIPHREILVPPRVRGSISRGGNCGTLEQMRWRNS